MTLANIKKSPLARLRSKLSSRKPESSVEEQETRNSTSSSNRSSSSLNVDELRTVFDYIDANSDGKISGTELQSCVSLLGGALSSRGGGGREDFGRGRGRAHGFRGVSEADDGRRRRYGFPDVCDGGEEFITAASLRRTLSRLGESCTVEACKVMIRGFDRDGDGVLSFDEFLLMMR
ncbi:hypothetical protein Bca52824_094996 [Brassica carinata]|uniref:EF-hand domain-containing protein n=1 Tax=Brassica carinata TaxID=52824 RepID=A0A8X7TIL4_BRACI|nr:hypothetical protein Bca52824_094996 [Brassica carinata]